MQSQQQQRRRKKRPNYGTRTVEVKRAFNLDFGFTISGQQPCRLSCIVANSPAEQAGLRPGDYLISVNGLNVSKLAHETVVQLIGNSFGSIRMQIAENYFSDSSDEENATAAALFHAGNSSPLRATMAGVRQRPRFLHHRAKMHRLRNSPQKRHQTSPNARLSANNPVSNEPLPKPTLLKPLIEDLPLQSATTSRLVPAPSTKANATAAVSADVANVSAMVRVVPSAALEYRVIVGYLGTIEMPKQISHSSKLQTVRSCIRKLRQEKRQPTTVLMTILPDCLQLRAPNGNVIATYASARLNYVSSSSESENRFFGLVTSAVHTSQADDDDDDEDNNAVDNNANGAANVEVAVRPTNTISISNSCHVFMVDTKLCDHHGHLKRATEFHIDCTRDPISSLCLEFPRHAEYVVNLIRSMYTMRILPPATRHTNAADEPVAGAAAAHSPQPSNHSEISTTTSNSDSGIGFHNDYANISDRILVVDFPGNRAPLHLLPPPAPANSRPLGIFNNFDPASDNRLTVRAMPDPKTAGLPPPRPPALGLHNSRAGSGRPDLLANFNLIKSPGTCSLAATRSCDDVLGLVDSRSADDYENHDLYLPASHASMDDLALAPNLPNSLFIPPADLPPQKRAAGSDTYALLEDYRSGTRSSRRSLQDSVCMPHKLSPQVFATPKSLNTTPTKSKSTTRYSFGWSCNSSSDILTTPTQSTTTAVAPTTNTISSSALFEFDVDTWSSLQNLHAMVKHEYKHQVTGVLEATNSEPDLGNHALPSNASPFRRAWGQSSFRTSRSEKQSPLAHHAAGGGGGGSSSPLVRRAASMTASDNDVYIKSMNGYVDELKQAQLKKLGSAASATAPNHGAASQTAVCFKTPTSRATQNNAEATDAATAVASVADWGTSFERLIEDAAGLNTFAEFLKKEFSAENIYFWTACERFRQTEDEAERAKHARAIFNKHLANGSLEPVNVDSQARSLSEEKLQNAAPDIFAPAQKQIFNLMKFDSYQRFIRSDLYKSCQEAEDKGQPLPYPAENLDELLRLSVHQSGGGAGAASKLKKSASNAEDRRRKSLLPWHRKTRSKSRDRCEAETPKAASTANATSNAPTKLPTLTTSSSLKIPSSHNSLSDIHSSRSSLSSFDAVTANVGQVHAAEAACALCRVILSDGATTIVQTRADETVGQLVERLLEKRGLQYKYYDVVATCGSSKSIDLQSNAKATLAGKEVLIEQRVAFKIDLPDPKVISVKSKPKKALHEVIRPILHKYNYEMDAVQVFVRDTQSLLDLSLPVTVVDGQRLQIVLLRQSMVEADAAADYQNACSAKFVRPTPLLKSNSAATMAPAPFAKSKTNCVASRNGVSQSTLDEITNKVFNEVLQGKVEAHDKQQQQRQPQQTKISDLCSIKSDECASETSSIFERIRRRDSSNIPAPRLRTKKKSISSQHSDETTQNGPSSMTTPNLTNQTTTTTIIELKKPIIAKWKAGVKLQVTERVKENQDELLEGLKRAQLARLEDQRGTEINFELPDFLKHKENISAAASKLRKVRASLSPINTKTASETSAATITSPTTSTKSLPPILSTPPPKMLPQPAPRLSIANRHKASNSISPMKIDEEELPAATTSVSPTTSTPTTLRSLDFINGNSNGNGNGNGNDAAEQMSTDNSKGPPPLPPKPKVLPMKPSNWGAATNFGSNTSISKIPVDINRKLSASNGDAASLASIGSTQSLPQQQHCAYLEEPTSSFV